LNIRWSPFAERKATLNPGSQNIGKNLKKLPGKIEVARCAKFARNLNVFEGVSRNNSREKHPTELGNEPETPRKEHFAR
jgi:hypothetical protein